MDLESTESDRPGLLWSFVGGTILEILVCLLTVAVVIARRDPEMGLGPGVLALGALLSLPVHAAALWAIMKPLRQWNADRSVLDVLVQVDQAGVRPGDPAMFTIHFLPVTALAVRSVDFRLLREDGAGAPLLEHALAGTLTYPRGKRVTCEVSTQLPGGLPAEAPPAAWTVDLRFALATGLELHREFRLPVMPPLAAS